ncbi:hypothetical protein GSU68_01395 [Rathayibacter sp. VKM Ac-2759]|uniref:Ig-like domain-containing protein n=1 Tax=Rathayibacter sp. VKM Ac-2759 TaxID=2609252 RepID=UPI0013160348|nr:Ig-like domain-containing protein [Rathayibacter sp. VKM Ac-2759]QHC65363.1 hypothetical protein GSU68_01395 [Rathayibacter sp. VKM Ac-2759]
MAVAVGAGLAVAGSTPAQADTAGRYLVTVDSTAVSQQVVAALGVTDLITYEGGTAGFTATLTSRQQAALEADPRVIAVAPADVVFEGQAQVLPSHVLATEADKAPVRAGDGVTNYTGPAVAVIDSGVNPNSNYDLREQINCYGAGDASDTNGHGTAVSGYMAAIDDANGTVGIAPGAPIYSVRVLDDKNKGTAEGIVCALDWVSKNAASRNIKVVNMSLATAGTDDGNCGRSNNDVIHQMVCELEAKGITIVSSAGNTTGGKDLAAAIPAAYDEVLTATNIANYDGKPGGLAAAPCAGVDTADDTTAGKSNFAVSAADRAHTVAAPGVCPYTTKLGGSYAYVQSGTSMSAAAVSGVVLDCLSSGGSCAGKSPAQVRAQIVAQAKAGAERGRTFAGDPTRPIAGRYYGYAVSTLPTNAAPEPTTPPTTTPTTPPTTPPATDTQKPTVAITSPASGTTVAGSFRLVASASDNVGVTSVVFYAGTTKLGNGTAQSDGSWALTTSTAGYPYGTYAVTARAQDQAGNVATSAAISLRVAASSTPAPTTSPTASPTATPTTSPTTAPVDTEKPTATITSPSSGTTVTGSIRLVASADDNVGVTSVVFYAGTTKLGNGVKQSNGTWALSASSASYPNGTYPVTARAQDKAGNVGTSAAISLRVAN